MRMPVVANALLFDEESDLAGGAGVNLHLMVGRCVSGSPWKGGQAGGDVVALDAAENTVRWVRRFRRRRCPKVALGGKLAVTHDLVWKYCMDIQYRITLVLGQNGRLRPIHYNI